MEWYTVTVILGVFLVWSITTAILWCFQWVIVNLLNIKWTLTQVLILISVPRDFAVLLSFVPNLLLVGVYMMFLLPKHQGFKGWSGWEWLRTHYWPTQYVNVPEKTDPKQQFLYTTFPHGVFAGATIFGFTLNPRFENVVTVATSLLFWIPLVREFAALGGAIPANTHDIVQHLDDKHDIVLVPEGLRGVLYGTNEWTRKVLDTRRGFIRCAIGSNSILNFLFLEFA